MKTKQKMKLKSEIKGSSKIKQICSLEKMGAYIAAVIAIIFVFIVLDQGAVEATTLQYIGTVTAVFTMLVCAGVAIALHIDGNLTEKSMLILILVCGFAVKLGYVIMCPYNVNQHDVETLSSSGHLSYINRLTMGLGLPDSNKWQFYHPPLHHFLASLMTRFSLLVGRSLDSAFENVQLLTLLYSTVTMIVSCKLLKEIGLKGKAFLMSSAIIAFHPTFTILAGSINNDVLMIMFSVIAVYYLIKWCHNATMLNAVVIGLSVGLAMMTKFSAALIAATVGIVVLIRFIRDKNYKLPNLLTQATAFIAISMPLGMWYQIRNMILFHQPLGYANPLSVGNNLYTGDISLAKRLILVPLHEITELFCLPFDDYNIIAYTLKCSVFGEYTWSSRALCALLLIVNTLMILLSLAAMIRVMLRGSEKSVVAKTVLFVTWIIQVVFFVYFYISAPFGCTMDFRYIAPTVICGSGFTGLAYSDLAELNNKKCNVFLKVCIGIVFAFCMLSAIAPIL